jgi:outer membrane protein OmpA-like peptidoglycan-associated protein
MSVSKKSILALLGIFSCLILSHRARANVVGTDAQNFNPITSGIDFVTVQSSETLKPGIINLGLFLNYAVNSLPYIQDTVNHRTTFNDALLGLDLNAGMGLTRGWDVGFSLPQVLRQTVEDQQGARGEFESTGGTEFRVNTKVRLLGDDSAGLALIGSVNINRIENNPYTGKNPGPTYDIEAAADTMVSGRVAIGLNLGYRFRNPGSQVTNTGIQPLQDQMIASAAASYLVPDWDTKFITEIYGSVPAYSTSNNTDRALSSTEWLAGIKYDVTTNLAVHLGGAAGLSNGQASPDWRVYTGLNYAFGPVFSETRMHSNSHGVLVPEPMIEPLPIEETPSGQIEHFRTQKILFAFDSEHLVGKSHQAVEELNELLKRGFRELIIEGHTDSVGGAAYNMNLSILRAKAIRSILITQYGVDARKVVAVGYGKTRPIADNGNYQGRQLNRRVDFQIRR